MREGLVLWWGRWPSSAKRCTCTRVLWWSWWWSSGVFVSRSRPRADRKAEERVLERWRWWRKSVVSIRSTAIAAPTYAGGLPRFFNYRKCGAYLSSLSRWTTYYPHVTIRNVFFAATALSRTLSLPFRHFHDAIGRVLL